MALDTPAGIIDFSERFPALHRAGAFSLNGFPVNGVGQIRELVATYSQQIAFLNPLLRYGIELSISNLNGANGLRPLPTIDHVALGITEAQAEALAEQFERVWHGWANSRCDTTGTQTFSSVVSTALRRAFDTGEILISFDWISEYGHPLATRVKAIEPQRISRTGATTTGNAILQGVELDPRKRPVAIYIYPEQKQIGFQNSVVYQGVPARLPFGTAWGRHLLSFSVMDRVAPEVLRGISPLASALERAYRLDNLTDLTVRQQAAQLAVAWALVTEYDATEAAQALSGPALDSQERVLAHLDMMDAHFSVLPLHMPDGAKAAILPKGSKLTNTASNFPTQGYDTFTKRLQIELARAFGLGYSELTGDYSGDNFSSAKMSTEGPWSITTRRRAEFLAPIYQAAYENVIEEAIMRGMITLPRAVDGFYANRQTLCACTWQGPTKPIVDALKEATANDVGLANGSRSLSMIAAEQGTDWRHILKQRAREKQFAEALGLTLANNSQVIVQQSEPANEQ